MSNSKVSGAALKYPCVFDRELRLPSWQSSVRMHMPNVCMTNLPANTLSVVAMNRRPGRRAHSRRSADAAVQIMGRRTTLIAAETVGRTSLNTDEIGLAKRVQARTSCSNITKAELGIKRHSNACFFVPGVFPVQ
jgi:hypothetical protein